MLALRGTKSILRKFAAVAATLGLALGVSLVGLSSPASANGVISPQPYLALTQTNTVDCGYELQIMLPATPDAGTVQLTFTTATATAMVTLVDLAPSEIHQISVKGGNIDALLGNYQVVSITPAGDIPIACYEAVDIRLSYQSLGAPTGSMQLNEYVPTAKYSTPSVQVESYNDEACTMRVTGVLPSVMTGIEATPYLYVASDVFGYYVYLDEIVNGKMFSLELPLKSLSGIESLEGVGAVTSWGTELKCDGQWWQVDLVAISEGGDTVSTGAQQVWVNFVPPLCEPGTYSATGRAPCAEAEPGKYVAGYGAIAAVPCDAGTFSDVARSTRCLNAIEGYYVAISGASSASQAEPGTYAPGYGSIAAVPCELGTFSEAAGAAKCTAAPKGYFVASTGATSATKCATGLTTELTGARSINECYKQKFQTAKAINTPTKLKFGAKHETAGRADAGVNLNAVATGSCTVTKINKTVKQNGKNVKQPRWVIKATAKAGNCKVTFSNDGDYTYKPFSVTKTIKVTKTGK